MLLLFEVDRDEEGRPKVTPPRPTEPSAEQKFVRWLYYLGITDPDKVQALWAEERDRLKAEKAKATR